MTQQHLLPEEIDQLLDDELAPATAPLRAHLAECDECRARFEDAGAVTDLIQELPHLAPSHRFSERVLSQVPVNVPLRQAARDWLVELVPPASASRRYAIAAGGVIATILAVVTVALATQTDLLVFAADVMIDRVRGVALAVAGSVVAGLFGDQAFNAVAQRGTAGFAIAACVVLIGSSAAFASLRMLAASASRRRG